MSKPVKNPAKQVRKPSKRTNSDENTEDDGEFLQAPTGTRIVADDDDDDDVTSTDKHGFMTFPKKHYEKLSQKSSSSNADTDEESSEEPDDRQPQRMRMQTSMQFRPPVIVMPFCGCFCHRPPCCPCRQWTIHQTPAKCYGMMPFEKFVKHTKKSPPKKSKRSISGKKSSPIQRKTSTERNQMEEKIEFEGIRDQEFASIVVNNARSTFGRAISEDQPKEVRRSPSSISRANNRMEVRPENDTLVLNKASENFRKIAKEEKEKNEKGLHKTTKTKVKFEIEQGAKGRGEERVTQRNTTTLMTTKPNENFQKNVRDARVENVKLNEKPEDSKRKSVGRSRLQRSKKGSSKGKK